AGIDAGGGAVDRRYQYRRIRVVWTVDIRDVPDLHVPVRAFLSDDQVFAVRGRSGCVRPAACLPFLQLYGIGWIRNVVNADPTTSSTKIVVLAGNIHTVITHLYFVGRNIRRPRRNARGKSQIQTLDEHRGHRRIGGAQRRRIENFGDLDDVGGIV